MTDDSNLTFVIFVVGGLVSGVILAFFILAWRTPTNKISEDGATSQSKKGL